MEGRHATDYNLQFKLDCFRGLASAYCSYQLMTNLKNNIDCLFGQLQRPPLNSPSVSHAPIHPGVFQESGVELGLSGFSKWRAIQLMYQTTQEWEENRDICRKRCGNQRHDNRTDGKVIILLKCQHTSALFA